MIIETVVVNSWLRFTQPRFASLCKYSNHAALECSIEVGGDDQVYRNRNKDRRRESYRQYYIRNGDAKRESNRQYLLRNKDKIASYERDYRLQNLDKAKEYDRQYNLKNKDKKKEYQQDSSSDRRYNLENGDSVREYERLYRLQNKDKRTEYVRKYRGQSGEEMKEYVRLYRSRNRSKVNESRRQQYLRNHSNPDGYLPRNSALKSWKSPGEVREYFESIGKELCIAKLTDWYRISRTQIASLGGEALCRKYRGLGHALQYAYPEINWDLNYFSSKSKKSGQRWLKILIEELLPGVEVVENYLHPELLSENSDRSLEIDVWIPMYQIGIEFQGELHYYNMNNAFGPNGAAIYSDRDSLKATMCQRLGITLILIPFWWNGERQSLFATLYQSRPDVFPPNDSNPIPTEHVGQKLGRE